MKFKLIIDKTKDEEIVAIVHAPTALTDQIEVLVRESSGADRIPAYMEGEMKMLAFSDIECITVLDGKTYAIDIQSRQYRLKMRLYELEELPLASAILLHGAGLYVAYILIYLLNGWLQQQLIPILIFTAVFIVGYAVIWCIIYAITKRKTQQLNRKLRSNP